ncbi:MAG: hypothetical protein RL596_2163, partial [Bacteroidota bacterium]
MSGEALKLFGEILLYTDQIVHSYTKQLLMYALTTQHLHKRAFITGAASGLGKAFALELAADGWLIGLAD